MTTEEKIKGLEHLLRKRPDVITPKDVETILGWLKITKAHNAEIVPREWLIDFTCDYAFRIIKKSQTHRELLDKYFG